ncbi:unnamed protein product [Acanthosepion pharaonis]|uniref:Uncharacterized protein n=1 Tax=Acanthosepion pharaonis TaxID=158019 RepID=A0A812AXR9_ACAPH|nr:unnamed protein product [Sepia pharaonis]
MFFFLTSKQPPFTHLWFYFLSFFIRSLPLSLSLALSPHPLSILSSYSYFCHAPFTPTSYSFILFKYSSVMFSVSSSLRIYLLFISFVLFLLSSSHEITLSLPLSLPPSLSLSPSLTPFRFFAPFFLSFYIPYSGIISSFVIFFKLLFFFLFFFLLFFLSFFSSFFLLYTFLSFYLSYFLSFSFITVLFFSYFLYFFSHNSLRIFVCLISFSSHIPIPINRFSLSLSLSLFLSCSLFHFLLFCLSNSRSFYSSISPPFPLFH